MASVLVCSRDEDLQSPTDSSEDSVDVKVKIIAAGPKGKRKYAEPRRFEETKRRLVEFRGKTEAEISPFRPWSHGSQADQEQPLSLVLRERLAPQEVVAPNEPTRNPQDVIRLPEERFTLDRPMEEKTSTSTASPQDVVRLSSSDSRFSIDSTILERPDGSSSTSEKIKSGSLHSQQRNYKNMTRERRIEANARERTRVHTISAAFDTLRRAVPAYSHNQKLSKLSVLRIACSYILTLSRVAGRDYSADSTQPPLADCVDAVTRTIQMEGKLRKKRDD